MPSPSKKNISQLPEIDQGLTDIHCHCLAGVDDGPASDYQSIELCRMLVEQGVYTVVASVHQLGRFDGRNSAPFIRERVTELNFKLRQNEINLVVKPGGDVRIDERLPELISQDKVLTIADNGRYMLLELPHEVLVDISELINQLNKIGIEPVITHPERHLPLSKRPELLKQWLKQNKCHLQITAASLTGLFGENVRKYAWQYVLAGMVCAIASDAHGVRFRPPALAEAYNQVSQKIGPDAAKLLFEENPARIVEGLDVVPMSMIKELV